MSHPPFGPITFSPKDLEDWRKLSEYVEQHDAHLLQSIGQLFAESLWESLVEDGMARRIMTDQQQLLERWLRHRDILQPDRLD